MNSISCPACQAPLAATDGTLECSACGGRFLPAAEKPAELAELAKRARPASGGPQLGACPACNRPMERREVAGSSAWLGVCPGCGALWVPPPPAETEEDEAKGPGILTRTARYTLFALSLPERTVRSAAGMAGGVAYGVTSALVPQAFQNLRLYRSLVHNALRFWIEDVGGVEGQFASDTGPKIDNFVARKAIGNLVEMAGILTFYASPLLVLAVVSDVAYGSKSYLHELAGELKRQGIVSEGSVINSVEDLMDSVAQASGTSAFLFDTPPLSVAELRRSLSETREAIKQIDPAAVLPQAEIQRLWLDLHDVAEREKVGLFQASSAVTLHMLSRLKDVGRGAVAGVKVGALLAGRNILGHYRDALVDLHTKGYYRTVSEFAGPYADAVYRNFTTSRGTITEQVLSGSLFLRVCRGIGRLFRRKKRPQPAGEGEAPAEPPTSPTGADQQVG